MQAVFIEQYGTAEQLTLGERPRPEITAGQVLIKVHGAGVNPVDWMIRQGYLEDTKTHQLPLILGWDAAGVIVDRGEQVTNLDIGDQVYVYAPIAEQGAYAEYLAVDSNLVARMPASLNTVTAAAVPLAATTAWQALREGCRLKAGERILIHNAAGGVGSFAVQIAKALGAHVIATASAANEEFVRGLGADEFIDYRNQRFEDHVGVVDAVLVAVGGEDLLKRSLMRIRRGGALVSLLDELPPGLAEPYGVRYQRWWVSPNAIDLQQIGALIDQGDITVHIDRVFPLTQVTQAHALSESRRARGKIVLQIAGDAIDRKSRGVGSRANETREVAHG